MIVKLIHTSAIRQPHGPRRKVLFTDETLVACSSIIYYLIKEEIWPFVLCPPMGWSLLNCFLPLHEGHTLPRGRPEKCITPPSPWLLSPPLSNSFFISSLTMHVASASLQVWKCFTMTYTVYGMYCCFVMGDESWAKRKCFLQKKC